MDSYTKIPKKKRFSQHKPNTVNYKITYSLKKNEFTTYDKSNSVSKNKKLRLHTDYADHDYSSYQPTHLSSFSNLRPATTKKASLGQTNNFKRKQSFNKEQKDSQYKISKNFGGKQFAINSTKYDTKKNNDLKVLFGNPYESKIKNHKKSKQGNHNISFFLNVGKQPKPSQITNSVMSPYSQQMNHFLKQNQKQHNKSRQHNQSVSRDKKDMFSRQKPNKRSESKGHRESSTPKHIQLKLINKDNIRLKTTMGISQKKQKQQNKRYSQNNQSKINNFFTKKPTNSNAQHKKSQNYAESYGEAKRQDEQSTLKIIKRPEPSFNPKQSSLRQLESSRVASQESYVQDDFGLTDEEIQTFGDRFPYGFEKMKLLGRGGFSLVWLGKHIKSGKQFAIKQIITNNTHQTHIKQIWFGTMFFTLGGVPKPQFSSFDGIKNLVRLYSYEINQTDTWIFYQKCGRSLGAQLYDIKSERVFGQEKLYKIHYKPFYLAMQKNPSILPNLVVQICKSLALISECQIVHSDLKTENILIKFDEDNNFKITELKLIDYGSSFQFRNISQFSMATPEYMPPEILNYIIHQNEGEYEQGLYDQVMNNYQNPWAVDMWSLGCVLLEIVVGVPLWMSLPLLVPNKVGKSFLQKEGLFAVKGRLFPQIIAKQRQVVSRLSSVFEKQNYSKISLSPQMKKILKGMLQIDFNKRISPNEVIEILSSEI